MRRWLYALGLVLCCTAVPLVAQTYLGIDEALTVDSTAGGVAIATATHAPTGLTQAVYCSGVLETAEIRMLDNGDAPTTTVGTLVPSGTRVEIFGHEYIAAARFIRTGAVSGLIHFTCYPRLPPWAR